MIAETMKAEIAVSSGLIRKAYAWILRMRQPARQLRMCESLSLGEKRTVAVLQFEGQRYLVGATASSITLLSRIPESSEAILPADLQGEPCEG